MKSTKYVTASILSLLISTIAAAPAAVHARPAAATPVVQVCSWDKPGRDPFVGDVVAAVDRYQDIPSAVRAKLKQRMAARSYDEFVAIERDAIVGKHNYASAIRDMHFGEGRICKTVTRAKWTESMRERGMVYCEGQYCILVPTVCRNVSRITRLGGGSGAATAGAAQTETILTDNLDALTDGKADGAFDPLADGDSALLDGAMQGAGQGANAGNGATTFGRVAAGSTGTVASLLAARSASGSMGSSAFASPFAGGSSGGGGGSGGGGPGGTELEWGAAPVPEAPVWMMMGVAALAFGWVGRRRATPKGAARSA